jgi:hypothetical protein
MDASIRLTEYTSYLRRTDPRFFLAFDADTRDPSRGAYWVKYQLGPYPLKIAAVSEFPAFWSGPGDWLRQVLERIDWRWMIASAKTTFSQAYDARRAMGLDRAQRVPFA